MPTGFATGVKLGEGDHRADIAQAQAAVDLGQHALGRGNGGVPQLVQIARGAGLGQGVGMVAVERHEAHMAAGEGQVGRAEAGQVQDQRSGLIPASADSASIRLIVCSPWTLASSRTMRGQSAAI